MPLKFLWTWALVGPLCLLLVGTMCVWPGPRGAVFEKIAFGAIFVEPVLALALLAAIPVSVSYFVRGMVWRREPVESRRFLNKSLACLCIGLMGASLFWVSVRIRHAAFERAAQTGA